MIKVENINKNFKCRSSIINALKDINLTIPKGEFVGIVGPSGSGKTTFLLTLGGLISPTSGKVYIKDKSLYQASVTERASIRLNSIGFLFQTFNLIPYMTALENVQIPLFLAGKTKEEQIKRAKELLERFGLGHRFDHKPPELSIGQQQRVALARALANNPEIIMADEPTGNLDPKLTDELVDYFKELNKTGITIVMVTHNPAVAQSTKRHISIVDGKIIS